MNLTHTLAAAVVLVSASSATLAASEPWSDPEGQADSFAYSGGGSTDGLFGDPRLDGDTFTFSPAGFAYDSADDDGSAGSTLGVTLDAGEAMVSAVRFVLLGDYGNLAGVDAEVSPMLEAFGLLTLTNLETGQSVSTSVSETYGAGSGLIELRGEASLPGDWSQVSVSLDSGLTGEAEATSLAFGQFKSAGLAVETAAVPLPPAALAVLPLGVAAYLKKRRRGRGA